MIEKLGREESWGCEIDGTSIIEETALIPCYNYPRTMREKITAGDNFCISWVEFYSTLLYG